MATANHIETEKEIVTKTKIKTGVTLTLSNLEVSVLVNILSSIGGSQKSARAISDNINHSLHSLGFKYSDFDYSELFDTGDKSYPILQFKDDSLKSIKESLKKLKKE